MLRTLLCFLLTACAVTSSDPLDAADPPPETEGPIDLFAKLRDDEGRIPGLAAVERLHRTDPTRCGGVAVDIRITGTIRDDDRPLAHLLQLTFPAQLDFRDATWKPSMERFNVFVESLRSMGMAARKHYLARLDEAEAGPGRLAATARLVQVHRHLAALLARAEIPVDMRSGEHAAEKSEAFCEKLAAAGSPFLVQANEAVRSCLGMTARASGWWTAVCDG